MRRCRQFLVPLAIGGFCATLLAALCVARTLSRASHAQPLSAPAEASR